MARTTRIPLYVCCFGSTTDSLILSYVLVQVEHKVISKANMGRMKVAYDAQKAGEGMPARPELPIAEQMELPMAKRRKVAD